MAKKFEREIKRELEKNLRGQESDEPIECPNCGTRFKIPGQVVMFGGEMDCPNNCGQTFSFESDAGDQVASAIDDFRKSLERSNKKNRRRR